MTISKNTQRINYKIWPVLIGCFPAIILILLLYALGQTFDTRNPRYVSSVTLAPATEPIARLQPLQISMASFFSEIYNDETGNIERSNTNYFERIANEASSTRLFEVAANFLSNPDNLYNIIQSYTETLSGDFEEDFLTQFQNELESSFKITEGSSLQYQNGQFNWSAVSITFQTSHPDLQDNFTDFLLHEIDQRVVHRFLDYMQLWILEIEHERNRKLSQLDNMIASEAENVELIFDQTTSYLQTLRQLAMNADGRTNQEHIVAFNSIFELSNIAVNSVGDIDRVIELINNVYANFPGTKRSIRLQEAKRSLMSSSVLNSMRIILDEIATGNSPNTVSFTAVNNSRSTQEHHLLANPLVSGFAGIILYVLIFVVISEYKYIRTRDKT